MQQIHSDFEATVVTFKTVQYDIMDVSRKEFDDDFYEFRCKIKNLEVCRLLSCFANLSLVALTCLYGCVRSIVVSAGWRRC